jgi:hypothetical protein
MRGGEAKPPAEPEAESLLCLAADPGLGEDSALALLTRRDLAGEVIESLARNVAVMKKRRVLKALVSHPRTPRHISLPRTRHLYTFELMELSLSPAVAADVKLAGEEVILTRLSNTSAGERLTLAKRGSKRLAAALLLDSDTRVMEAALRNSRMVEGSIVRALQSPKATPMLVEAICRSSQWSVRREVQIALLRNSHTPLTCARQYLRELPAKVLEDLQGYFPEEMEAEVARELERRRG